VSLLETGAGGDVVALLGVVFATDDDFFFVDASGVMMNDDCNADNNIVQYRDLDSPSLPIVHHTIHSFILVYYLTHDCEMHRQVCHLAPQR
jgi:hypothetical protein